MEQWVPAASSARPADVIAERRVSGASSLALLAGRLTGWLTGWPARVASGDHVTAELIVDICLLWMCACSWNINEALYNDEACFSCLANDTHIQTIQRIFSMKYSVCLI